MNEQETRTNKILPALHKAGWGKVEGAVIREEFKISQGRLIGNGQRSRPLDADYVLQYRNRNLAVVEAKSDQKTYTEGLSQAKNYAKLLHVRFTYSTNGDQIYQVDMNEAKEGDVDRYPTPDELWDMTFALENATNPESVPWRDTLTAVPFEDKGGAWQPRYYILNAVNKVIESMSKGQDRILLTLATGTGKTAIAFQISWKLYHSRWNLQGDGKRLPRILFLADRNILADQAFNSFGAFDEDALVRIKPGEIKKKGKVPTNGSIFFTIFQTFMSGNNGEPYFGQYPKDYFDFIVIDECHRGGANDESNWRAIMEYFSPAVQLGLTATPKRNKNIDTYRYFGEPVYVYSLKEGINDGFLTPFKVKQIHTTIDEYIYTSDDTVVTGDIEEGRVYTEYEINRVIEIKEREAYRVKTFMDSIDQNQKTLVFCSTQIHALAVRDLINQYTKVKNPDYCKRVTSDEGKLGEQHLRDFQDNEKIIPTILTTSQKLSTGVDAPEIRNIVLMRPVNSMIEFKQIIGRGTRLFDGKDHFTIYDFVSAYKHFLDPEWDGEPLDPEGTGTITPSEAPKPPVPPFEDDGDDTPPKKMIKVKLADGKIRELQHVEQTSFWSADGLPISSEQFLKSMFGNLPDFFKNEDELRAIWSKPDTRKKLLQELNEKGYSKSQLEDLRRMVKAVDSDLYDMLAYVAFSTKPIKRIHRAHQAKEYFNRYKSNQRVFLDFVLKQYIQEGVSELDDTKLPDLLTLKYKAIADAKQELGDIAMIRDLFIDFQQYLYK